MKLHNLTIIYNPKGGSASQNRVNEVAGCFVSRGVKVSYLATTAIPGSATKLAQQAVASAADLIVAFGGDGTACQVAEGLIGTDVPMAVFPGGTGNLFARTFYAEPTPEQFAEMILGGIAQPIDMVRAEYTDRKGAAQSRLFMVGLGLGKVSDAISTASPTFKRIFGRLFYVFKVALACLWPNARRFHLTSAGSDSSEEAAALFALNVVPPMMTNLSRGCNPSDGLMDVIVFRARNVFQLIGVAICLACGTPERSRHYRRFRTASVTIKCKKLMLPNIDGDPGDWTGEVKLTVCPRAVRMVLS